MNQPWLTEPDELDWQDEKTGLQCRIVRCGPRGHLCGYVQVPESHPLAGRKYMEALPESLTTLSDATLAGPVGKRGPIDAFIIALRESAYCGDIFDVHGSITFSGTLRGKEGFWYGFDCAHSGDLNPSYAEKYGWHDGEYRDIEYVKSECASLASQIMQVNS